MAAVIPFDQFFGATPAPARSNVIPPEVQAQRDEEAKSLELAPAEPASQAQHQGDVDAIQKELSRSDTTPSSRKILQDELVKAQGRLAGGGAKAIPFDDFFKDSTAAPTAAHQDVAHSILTDTWAGVKKTPGNLAALADMVLSIPAGLIGVGADMATRTYQLGADVRSAVDGKYVDHRVAGIMAEKFRNETQTVLANPLQKLMKAAGYGEDYSNSDVATGMNWFSQKVLQGGGAVEKATGGALTKEDVGSLVNELMQVGGGKGLDVAIRGKLEAMAKPAPAPGGITTAQGVLDARKADGTPTPEGVAAAHLQAEPFDIQAVINKSTGVTATEAAAQVRESTRADARRNFKDDADYTTYLRKNMEMRVADQALSPAAIPKPRFKLRSSGGKVDPVAEANAPLDLSPEALDMAAAQEPKVGEEPAAPNIEGTDGSVLTPKVAKKFQRGGASPETLIKIAAAGAGIYAGIQLDDKNPFTGAIVGGMLGLGAGKIGKVFDSAKRMVADDPRIRINDLTEARETQEFRALRETKQFQDDIVSTAPKGIDRVKITKALDEGWTGDLPEGPRAAALKIKRLYATLDGANSDLVEAASAAYNNNVWNYLRTKDSDIKGLIGTTSRRITVQEGKAAGLTPLTEDAAVLSGVYSNAMARAVANKAFVNSLRDEKIPGSNIVLAAPPAKAPPGYVTAGIRGMLVHPDIAPSVRFLMEAQDPNALWAGLGAVNTALKRTAVSVSLFHAKSLFDAGVVTLGPARAVKVLAQSAVPRIFGENMYLKQLREGGAGDLVDFAGSSGLKFSMDRWQPGSQDLQSSSFYGGMKALQKSLDETIPGLGQPIRALAAVNHAFDHFTWNRLHAAFKLETFAKTLEMLEQNNGAKGALVDRVELGRQAADFTNFAFGGINWGRFAESFTTRMGRDAALKMFSPAGRRAMNQGIFALDWTIATNGNLVRAVTRDMGMGAVKGLFSAKNLGDLHRQNIVRGLIYYAVVGDSVNYAMSGHHLWDNKDWTRVEMGDGRSMQLSKHLMEGFEFMQNPAQTIVNKSAQVPREVYDQLFDKEYPSVHDAPPIVPKGTGAGRAAQLRIEHAVNTIVPIGVNQFARQGLAAGVAGMLGVPIYGQTDAQKRTARLQKALDNYQKQAGQP